MKSTTYIHSIYTGKASTTWLESGYNTVEHKHSCACMVGLGKHLKVAMAEAACSLSMDAYLVIYQACLQPSQFSSSPL